MRPDEIPTLVGPRQALLDRLVALVGENLQADSPPLQHVLITGPWGSGKTTVLQSLVARLPQTFGETVVAHMPSPVAAQAALPETMLADAAFAALPDADLAEAPPFPWRGGEEDAWVAALEKLNAALKERFESGPGLLVLILDDFDAILSQVFSNSAAESRLRRLLQEQPRLMLIAATRRQGLQSDYDRPLFQMFLPESLEPLSADDIVDIGATAFTELHAVGRATITALAHILGPGQPRRLNRLVQLARNSWDTPTQLLLSLIDSEASTFERQIEGLSMRPRRLLDALLVGGEPARPAALAERLQTKQSDIAPTLSALVASGLLQRQPGSRGRTIYYAVADRLLAMWYLTQRVQDPPPTFGLANIATAALLAQARPRGDIVESAASGWKKGRELTQLRRAEAYGGFRLAWDEGPHEFDDASFMPYRQAVVAAFAAASKDKGLLFDIATELRLDERHGGAALLMMAAFQVPPQVTAERDRDDEIGQVAWSRLASIHPDVVAALLMLRDLSGEAAP